MLLARVESLEQGTVIRAQDGKGNYEGLIKVNI